MQPRAPTRAALAAPPLREEPAPAKPARGALMLSFRDDESGAAVALRRVQLWRLGLPEDDDWTAGDLLQGRFEVPVEGLRIPDLPEGRYRVYSYWLRFGSDDPPEFEVFGVETVVELAVPMCRDRRVHLKLFDGAGRSWTATGRRGGGCTSGTRSGSDYPSWRVRRTGKRREFREPSGDVRGCGPGEKEFRSIVAGPWGFDLGEFRDASRVSEVDFWLEFESDGRTAVWLLMKCDTPRDRTYWGVAFRDEIVDRSVFLPSGALAAETHGIVVTCRAVLEDDDLVPVKVTVRGFETECLLLRVGEPFPVIWLRPTSPDPSGR